MKTVNAKGLKEIQGYLSDLHTQETFTATELSQFAAEVVDSLNELGAAQFVIAAHESKTGQAEVCTLDDEGYDIEFFDLVDPPTSLDAIKYKKNHDCQRSGCTVCVAFEH